MKKSDKTLTTAEARHIYGESGIFRYLSNWHRLWLILAALIFIANPAVTQENTGVLKAGAAKIDITPDKPVDMAGYSARKGQSQGIHDRLFARAVAFEENGKELVFISNDILGFYNGSFEYIQKSVLDKTGLKPGDLFLCSVHAHSGPVTTVDREIGHANNFAYTEDLKNKLVDLVVKARSQKKTVTLGVGRGYSSVGSNRRELRTNLKDWPDESGFVKLGRNPYGLTDKEVLVIKLSKEDGKPVAVMFDYACHATSMGSKNFEISGDIFGLAEQFVEKITAMEAIAPGFAGASGNIDPWYRVLPAFNTEPGWIPETVLLATLLGEEVVHVMRNIGKNEECSLIRSSFKVLDLPGKKRGEAVTQSDSLRKTLNLSAAAVGNIAFVGLGGEICTEIGMSIKEASPFPYTFVISHCNGAAGYLAPEHLFREGGYEVTSSEFRADAADIVVREALQMLYEFRKK